MKEFNLQEYLENPNRKIVTRDGRPVQIVCTDRKSASNSPIIALVTYDVENEFEQCYTYTSDGKLSFRNLATAMFRNISDADLFFAPTKHDGWVNLYRNNDDIIAVVYSTKEKAQARAGGVTGIPSYVTTTKIEWEE